MSRLITRDIDFLQLCQQFSIDLAQAQSRDDAVACCAALIESCFTPLACQIVWRGGPGTQVLGPRPEPSVPLPSDDELAQLEHGQLVFRDVTRNAGGAAIQNNGLERGEVVFPAAAPHYLAPLIARGALVGWLVVADPVWSADGPAMLAVIAAQLGPALALLDGAVRQEERLDQLRTLNEIGRLLSGVLDPDTLLEAIYSATRRIVDAPNFFIALYDQGANELDLGYIVHQGQREKIEERWTPDVGLASVLIRERRPLCTDDYVTECRRRGVPTRALGGLPLDRAWLGLPMLAHDRFIGIMVVSNNREGYVYSAEHIELLATIAAHAAVAIENARLYQRSERQARQLATLNQIGRTLTSSLDPQRVPSLIIEQVTSLMDAEEGSLLLVDGASGDMIFAYTTGPVGRQLLGQRLPRGVGLAGYVVTQGRSVIVNDAQQDGRFYATTDKTTGFTTRTLLAVPLRGVGGVQGVIEVINRRGGRLFAPEDQRLLEAIADQAVIALENAQRFGQVDQALARRAQELVQTNDMLQHNLRSLTALNALGMAINTSLRSPDEIFAMTTRGVIEMTQALGACVLVDERGDFRTLVHIGPAPAFVEAVAPALRAVMASGRPEMLLANLPAPLTQSGASALLIVPLRATRRTTGCLCVYYGEAVPGSPDQETVVLFATQAAVAVESIELFEAVRGGRDQMASILASTREGIMLIAPDGRVAVANDALHQLCGLDPQSARDRDVAQFLAAWGAAAGYAPDEWEALRQGLTQVIAGHESFVGGELNESSAHARAVEWTALVVQGSADSQGGALLVLRDITEAKESERLRHDLTNMIVHDLRSPLSSVMASIDMLVKGVAGTLNPTQRGVLNIAYSSSQQMLEMINTLLDISRLEAGRMPLDLRDYDLRSLYERAAEQLSALAQERSMLIQSDIPADLPLVRADGEAIVRVLQNLLVNALKFSGRGSTVLVRAFESGPEAPGFVTVSVSDCGIGIAPKDREKIFAKFGQVGERRGGTGLGLTFCKLVVETHGGAIWVESTLGTGSTFFFTLPIAQPAARLA